MPAVRVCADQIPQTKGDEQQEAVTACKDGAPHLWRTPQPQSGQGQDRESLPD